MLRIAVLGNGGGGKSTLARKLAETHELPYVEIDQLQWREGWEVVPRALFDEAHQTEIEKDCWVIDGLGHKDAIRARLDRSTDIVLIDMPLWVHFWLAAERQQAWKNGTLTHKVGSVTEAPPTKLLFETIWRVDREWMPDLRRWSDQQEEQGKRIHRIPSFEALQDFTLQSLTSAL